MVGPVDHHLGTLCRLLGRTNESEQRLRRALEIEERMGATPFAARSRAQLALLLLERDPHLSRTLFDAALADARSVGAVGIVNEIEDLLQASHP
jgi:hypothetical protein